MAAALTNALRNNQSTQLIALPLSSVSAGCPNSDRFAIEQHWCGMPKFHSNGRVLGEFKKREGFIDRFNSQWPLHSPMHSETNQTTQLIALPSSSIGAGCPNSIPMAGFWGKKREGFIDRFNSQWPLHSPMHSETNQTTQLMALRSSSIWCGLGKSHSDGRVLIKE